MQRLNPRAGFTLIEALVAFAILALAMGQLLAAAGGAARNEARADFYLRATREGLSQLEALGVATPILLGETRGTYDDGLLWILDVTPHLTQKAAIGTAVTTSYFVRLMIGRPNPQGASPETLKLTTIKLVTTRPDAPQ